MFAPRLVALTACRHDAHLFPSLAGVCPRIALPQHEDRHRADIGSDADDRPQPRLKRAPFGKDDPAIRAADPLHLR